MDRHEQARTEPDDVGGDGRGIRTEKGSSTELFEAVLAGWWVSKKERAESRGTLGRGLLAYFGTALLLLAPISVFYDLGLWLSLGRIGIGLTLGAGWLAAVWFVGRRRPFARALSAGLAATAAGVLGLTVASVVFGLYTLPHYGDRAVAVIMVQSGRVLEQWFLGSAAWTWFDAAVLGLPIVERMLPAAARSAPACVQYAGALAMAAWALVLLRRWPGRLSIGLALMSPIWWMLAAGYVEYYPMIAGLLVFALAFAFEPPEGLAGHSPYAVGALGAVLPLAYIAFAPFGLILMLLYGVLRPRDAAKVFAGALAVGLVVLGTCYPKTIPEYFTNLYSNLHFLEKDTWGPYRGQGITEGSNFFRPAFAFSPRHLGDLAYLYLFGGGPAFPALIAVLAWMAHRRGLLQRTLFRSRAFVCASAVMGWFVVYFVFYIPRLGPRLDIDLFFSTFLTVAYFSGYAADRLLERGVLRERDAFAIAAVALGQSAVGVLYLIIMGLPDAP